MNFKGILKPFVLSNKSYNFCITIIFFFFYKFENLFSRLKYTLRVKYTLIRVWNLRRERQKNFEIKIFSTIS